MTGQNGAQTTSKPKLQVSCGSNQKHKKHAHGRKAAG
jgi:hypothetical protein